MSNVVPFRRSDSRFQRIPVMCPNEAEAQRVSNQYCLNLTSIFRQLYGSLGAERAANIIGLAIGAATADIEADKRRV
jgi:hypothetical protein